MADHYYRLAPSGIELKLSRTLLDAEWQQSGGPVDCLLLSVGGVKTLQDALECDGDPNKREAIVMLQNASWTTPVGDTGPAVIESPDNCDRNHTWTKTR